jgi:H+-transporting ATPase
MLFLTAGLIMTGHAILTPMLMVILMVAGDFLAMSSSTDHVRPSAKPNAWRVDNLTIAGLVLGLSNLVFCTSILAVGVFVLNLPRPTLQSLAAITLVFSGQAIFYVVRERRHLWSSSPSLVLLLSSVADISFIAVLAIGGFLMAPLPVTVVAAVLAAAFIFAFILDTVKLAVFRRLKMT